MERGLKTFRKLLIFTHYTTNHRGSLSKTNQSYIRQKWKLNNASAKESLMCTLKSVNRCLPTCPRKQTACFLSKFSFSQYLENGRWKWWGTFVGGLFVRNTRRAQFYNKNDVSITLKGHHHDDVMTAQ